MANEHPQYQLKQFVTVADINREQVILSFLGQRIVLRTAAASEIPRVLELLKNPIGETELLAALTTDANSVWTQGSLSKFLSGLLQERLIFFVSPGNGASTISERWDPLFRVFSRSKDHFEQAKLNALKTKLIVVTRLSPPAIFLEAMQPTFVKPEAARFEGPTENFWLLLGSSSDHRLLQSLTPSALQSRRHVLPALLDLHGAVVGPNTGGHGRACLTCLAKRLKASLTNIESADVLADANLDEVSSGWPLTYWQKLDAIVQEELFKLKSELIYSQLERGAYIFDFLNHRSDFQEIFPVPGCVCAGS